MTNYIVRFTFLYNHNDQESLINKSLCLEKKKKKKKKTGFSGELCEMRLLILAEAEAFLRS
jgi:hypothetical protein